MEPGEQRRDRRYPMNLPGSVKTGASQQQGTAVTTKDVSSAGVYFEFDSPIDVGTPIEIDLALPGEITNGQAVRIRCSGRAIRIDKAASGDAVVGVAAAFQRCEFL